VALVQELPACVQPVLEVVLVDRRTDAHSFSCEPARWVPRSFFFCAYLNLPKSKIRAHGRASRRRDLDEVESDLLGASHRVRRRDDADLLSVVVDERTSAMRICRLMR